MIINESPYEIVFDVIILLVKEKVYAGSWIALKFSFEIVYIEFVHWMQTDIV